MLQHLTCVCLLLQEELVNQYMHMSPDDIIYNKLHTLAPTHIHIVLQHSYCNIVFLIRQF